jgi:hypothetical protein
VKETDDTFVQELYPNSLVNPVFVGTEKVAAVPPDNAIVVSSVADSEYPDTEKSLDKATSVWLRATSVLLGATTVSPAALAVCTKPRPKRTQKKQVSQLSAANDFCLNMAARLNYYR